MSGKWRVFPFTALVGQEKIKRALLANAVLPSIGGVKKERRNPRLCVVWLRFCHNLKLLRAARGTVIRLPRKNGFAPPARGKNGRGRCHQWPLRPSWRMFPCPPAKTG